MLDQFSINFISSSGISHQLRGEREKEKKALLGVKKVILQENSTREKRGGDRHQQMSEDRQQ